MGSFGGLSVTSEKIQEVLNEVTGYAVYSDTQYTSASPFTIAQDSTVTVPNNAGSILNQLPTNVLKFYDAVTTKIVPDTEFDRLTVTLRFLAKTSAAQGASLNLGIDIGGGIGVIFPDDRLFIRGANVEQAFNFVMPIFTGATFLANGGLIKLKSIGGITSIYNIQLHIERTFKGK